MMKDKIQKLIKEALKNLKISEIDFVVEHPEDIKNGDYSTNVAMVCAKKIKTPARPDGRSGGNPKELAKKITKELLKLNRDIKDSRLEKIEVAGAGFINFFLSPKFFRGSIEEILNNKKFAENNLFSGKIIMIEYTDPNPFKPFHIGHLMTNAIGESVARILEHSGATVSRANYQGDVGLHVAKAIHILVKNPEVYILRNESIENQASLIGKAYSEGTEAYEEDSNAKEKIDEINKKIYDRRDPKINEIYDWGFKATMEAFENLYRTLGTKFDFYFLESMMAPIGERIVQENLGKAAGSEDSRRIFEESDGAVVFKAEKHDPKLHTRVFVTSQGLPTYETKELGLTSEKFDILPDMDLSIVVTANEQGDYMKVVTKALSLIYPDYADKMLHITHGMMRFTSGKMSSRKGNAVTGETLIQDTKMFISEKMSAKEGPASGFQEDEKNKIVSDVAIAALKYTILKQSIGKDILYDFEKSISFEGDSGPYLQYSFTRANSVLQKAQKEDILPDPHAYPPEVFEVEKLLYRFPEIVLRAASVYEPHYITNYLIETARAYNSFYGNTVIVKADDPTSSYKIALTYAFTFVMKKGLHLLGIVAPEKM